MTTDYLGDLFPPYQLTENTSVVRCKRYFRKEGSGYVPVLNIQSSDNPKAKGWYEFVSNHNKEFKYNVDSLQMNNVAAVCHTLMVKLQQFPVWTLPRVTEVGTIKLDWTGIFADAKWNETIGMMVVPEYTVPFSTNMFFAANANDFLDTYIDFCKTGKTLADWQTLNTTIQTFVNAIAVRTGKYYSDAGYSFDPTTLTSTTRANDVFTLTGCWEDIEYRTIVSVLQDCQRDVVKVSGTEAIKTNIDKMLITFRDCARTMVDLSMKTNSLEVLTKQKYVEGVSGETTSISDHRSFVVKITTIPATMDIGGATYYRLNSKKQFKSNAMYGVLLYNNDGSVSVLEPESVADPSSKFLELDLPEYSESISTASVDVPVVLVQNKKIWFTNVPFAGA